MNKMYNDITGSMMAFLLIIIILIYFISFYHITLNRFHVKRFLRRFYNAICNVYEQMKNDLKKKEDDLASNYHTDVDLEYYVEQLNLNYEKLCQQMQNNKYDNIIDLLEAIICCYDSYQDEHFENVFRYKKDERIRKFIIDMCFLIKKENPFISIPKKDADLMQTLLNALKDADISLAENSIKQLSQEIEIMEKTIVKKDKENQRATVVSIVGIVLTIFFGLLSVLKIEYF